MTDEPERPVLYLQQAWQFTWQQHAPGGCRCLCRIYHHGDGACTLAAEPGHLLRVVTPAGPGADSGDITDALPLCAPCYDAIAPIAG